MVDRLAVLTMPAVEGPTPGPGLEVHRQHRGSIIHDFGVWLLESLQASPVKGMSSNEDPGSVWMHFKVDDDPIRYSLSFPSTSPGLAVLWRHDGERWRLMELFALLEFEDGHGLADAAMGLIRSGDTDTEVHEDVRAAER